MSETRDRIKALRRNGKTTIQGIVIQLIENGVPREDVGDILHDVLHEVRRGKSIGPATATEDEGK